MSDIFLRSDAALDAAISRCTDPEKIREITKAHLKATGVISRERGNDWGARVIGVQSSEPAPRLEERDTRPMNAERVLYLSGNSRIVITSANGEGALDAIENQLRASLGSQR
jgi:hypothetical protein